MLSVPNVNFDVKEKAGNMLVEYIQTSVKISEVYGKDETVYIPGYGEVSGAEQFKLLYGSEIYSKIFFEGAFSQLLKTYFAVADMEKQFNSSVGA